MVYFCLKITIIENISDSQPPPTKLRLQLSGEALAEQSSMAGLYSLQSSLVNGLPYWKHDSSDKAIWFYGEWFVGYYENIGTLKCGIASPHGIEEWPNSISSKWRVHINGNKFQEAANGEIIFEDCSF